MPVANTCFEGFSLCGVLIYLHGGTYWCRGIETGLDLTSLLYGVFFWTTGRFIREMESVPEFGSQQEPHAHNLNNRRYLQTAHLGVKIFTEQKPCHYNGKYSRA